jgi:hypothetical protein
MAPASEFVCELTPVRRCVGHGMTIHSPPEVVMYEEEDL